MADQAGTIDSLTNFGVKLGASTLFAALLLAALVFSVWWFIRYLEKKDIAHTQERKENYARYEKLQETTAGIAVSQIEASHKLSSSIDQTNRLNEQMLSQNRSGQQL